ncbi:ribonuclease 4 isoform X1 [Zalophus californianus]|nr:ribonuclease 4 isoform X1 [Zalophus californianus]
MSCAGRNCLDSASGHLGGTATLPEAGAGVPRPEVPGGCVLAAAARGASGLQALSFPRQGPPAAPTPEAGPGGRGLPGETGRGPNCTEAPAPPFSPCCIPRPFVYTHARRPYPGSKARFKRTSLRLLQLPIVLQGGIRSRGEKLSTVLRVSAALFPGRGISKVVMALQRTRSLLLLLLLTLLGLGLVQPSYGQDRMYQRFLRQHVDPEETGGNDTYCNLMMQRRKMVRQCKRFNTFIHEDIWNIRSICSTTNIQCKNGKMNCHEGVVKVTDCRETGSSRAPNCRYRASASTRHVVIACEGDPQLPVHLDR